MSRLRAALHAHSVWSHDGRLPLEQLARILGRRGYGAVLTSEHEDGFDEQRWRGYRDACRVASRATGTLLVPGIEYADPDNVVHVAVWGDLPFLGARRPTGALLADVARHGGAAMIAHPSRRDASARIAPDWLERVCGVEAWNRKTDGWAPSTAARALLAGRPGPPPMAGIDLHTRRQLFPLAAVITLDGAPSEAAIVAALRAGRFRATALGLPLSWFLRAPLGPLLGAAEAVRRPLAGAVRRRLNRGAARARAGSSR